MVHAAVCLQNETLPKYTLSEKKNNVRADVLRPLVQRTDFIIADFSAQEAVKGSLGRLLTQG